MQLTLSYLVRWLILLIVFFSGIDKIYKQLGPYLKKKPTIQGLLPESEVVSSVPLPALKSRNYTASTIEDQQKLMKIEVLLTNAADDLKPKTSTAASSTAAADQSQRWDKATYPSIANFSESTMINVSEVIMCSNKQIKNCDHVNEILKGCLFGTKTGKKIIFGFRLKLESLESYSAAQFRIKLHTFFHKSLWPAILKIVDFSMEEREIIFVGYESGGSLASLAAWHAIKQFDQHSASIVKNGNNQVKVITWDEIPLFTIKTSQKYPILPRNHFRFTTNSISESKIRLISQFSGGIDEVQYFASGGEEIKLKSRDYNDFMTRLATASNRHNQEDSDNDEPVWNPRVNLALFLKQKDFQKLNQTRLDELKELLTLHHDHLSIFNSTIFNTFTSFLLESKLAMPNSCAASLANTLANAIFPGPTTTITCQVDNFDDTKGTFSIYCSYKTAPTRPFSQFLSFDAVLGNNAAHEAGKDCQAFMEEIEIEDPKHKDHRKKKEKRKSDKSEREQSAPKMIKVKKYSGPPPVVDNWSTCLYHLFEQRPHIESLFSPFTTRNENFLPHCSYVPFETSSLVSSGAAFSDNESRQFTGCYLRSSNLSYELNQLYKSDQLFFYRLVDPNTMSFPLQCHKILFHISFKAEDRPNLPNLQQEGYSFLSESIRRNPIERGSVNLWTPRDTETYKSLAFIGSENISSSDLADRTNYQDDFENSILKCLSNPAFPYRDCTKELNRWVPRACPVACSRTNGAINFLCRQVKSCPGAGYYVSLSRDGSQEDLEGVQRLLHSHPTPQFGFFHVQKKGRNYFSDNPFNVALFRMPRT